MQPCKQKRPEKPERMMGNRHPLKAAKIGQITRGGGCVRVSKREGGGTFFLPAYQSGYSKWQHHLTASPPLISCRARLNISSGAKNKIKVIDVFLPVLLERETTENVTNSGLSAM